MNDLEYKKLLLEALNNLQEDVRAPSGKNKIDADKKDDKGFAKGIKKDASAPKDEFINVDEIVNLLISGTESDETRQLLSVQDAFSAVQQANQAGQEAFNTLVSGTTVTSEQIGKFLASNFYSKDEDLGEGCKNLSSLMSAHIVTSAFNRMMQVFNSAAAGFVNEQLLALLLYGKSVPAASANAIGNIADLEYGSGSEKIGISLKTKKSEGIGGSVYNALATSGGYAVRGRGKDTNNPAFVAKVEKLKQDFKNNSPVSYKGEVVDDMFYGKPIYKQMFYVLALLTDNNTKLEIKTFEIDTQAQLELFKQDLIKLGWDTSIDEDTPGFFDLTLNSWRKQKRLSNDTTELQLKDEKGNIIFKKAVPISEFIREDGTMILSQNPRRAIVAKHFTLDDFIKAGFKPENTPRKITNQMAPLIRQIMKATYDKGEPTSVTAILNGYDKEHNDIVSSTGKLQRSKNTFLNSKSSDIKQGQLGIGDVHSVSISLDGSIPSGLEHTITKEKLRKDFIESFNNLNRHFGSIKAGIMKFATDPDRQNYNSLVELMKQADAWTFEKISATQGCASDQKSTRSIKEIRKLTKEILKEMLDDE